MKAERTGQILRLSTEITMDALAQLQKQLFLSDAWGPGGVILEIRDISRINLSRLDRMLNTILTHLPGLPTAIVAQTELVWDQLDGAGLTAIVPTFRDIESAFSHAQLRPHTLSGVEALLLSAGKGTRAWPLSAHMPKPLFPLLGQPLSGHLIQHCRRFGIRDFCMNISHMASQIERQFQSGRQIGARITYSHEGVMSAKGFMPRPLGSASTLVNMNRQHGCFDQTFIVMCGDAPTDIDLADMMQAHARSGAIATVATCRVEPARQRSYGIIDANQTGHALRFFEKPVPGLTDSVTASTGIYIFEPAVLDYVAPVGEQDIGGDLLPGLIASGQHVNCYSRPFGWTDVGTFADYHHAELSAVSGRVPGLHPPCSETAGGHLLCDGASVSSGARLEGPVFVASGARIEAGAWLKGPVSIGAGCQVRARSIVQNSVLLAGTEVGAGSVVSGMVAGPDWALRPGLHLPAGQPLPGLEGLSPVTPDNDHLVASVA